CEAQNREQYVHVRWGCLWLLPDDAGDVAEKLFRNVVAAHAREGTESGVAVHFVHDESVVTEKQVDAGERGTGQRGAFYGQTCRIFRKVERPAAAALRKVGKERGFRIPHDRTCHPAAADPYPDVAAEARCDEFLTDAPPAALPDGGREFLSAVN